MTDIEVLQFLTNDDSSEGFGVYMLSSNMPKGLHSAKRQNYVCTEINSFACLVWNAFTNDNGFNLFL